MNRLASIVAVPAVLVAGAVHAAVPADARDRGHRLTAFTSCGALVDYGTRHLRRVRRGAPTARPVPGREGGDTVTAPAPAGGHAGGDFSTTNVQEAGIDEPDVVKTDGRTIFTVSEGNLRAIDARADAPGVLGRLRLPGDGFDHRMLMHAGKLLLFHTEVPEAPGAEPGGDGPRTASTMVPAGQLRTVLTEVDVREPAEMRVLRTFRIDGTPVSGRAWGSVARLVVQATPRAVIEGRRVGRLARWLPRASLREARTGRRVRRRAVACRAVHRPATFSGLSTVTVLTVDIGKGLPAIDSDTLVADAEAVYASREGLYLASRRWVGGADDPEGVTDGLTTAIHRFDASRDDGTTYRTSGAVPGFLLGQFAMSEHGGVLRVASTQIGAGDAEPSSESRVTVLDEREGALRPIGTVSGLGKGERIYAVRFLGEVGYVVTFREVDPLYAIDLSDPTAPRVRGELKIAGYSAYLHPAGPGRLIGVGQDATEEGRRLGAQVSLFDVSDLDEPRLLARHPLANGESSTDVEYDHHAFLWWAPTGLAVMPVFEHREGDPFVGAVALRIGDDGISENGRLSHPRRTPEDWGRPIVRSVVVGARLFTVSDGGLGVSPLAEPSRMSFVPY